VFFNVFLLFIFSSACAQNVTLRCFLALLGACFGALARHLGATWAHLGAHMAHELQFHFQYFSGDSLMTQSVRKIRAAFA